MAMNDPIYRVPYDAENIAAWCGKTPIVDPDSKHWLVWDISAMDWVDTGIYADGQAAATAAEAAAARAEAAAGNAEALQAAIYGAYPNAQISDASVASFSDGADGIPVKRMTVNIMPAQSGSGDPSPDNVRPISGWTGANVTRCGKNLFDKSTVVTGEINSTGGINTAATSIRTSAYIKVNPSTEYILYDICSTSSVSYCWAEYDGSKTFISTGTITGTIQKRLTTSATTSYIRVCVLPAKLDSCIVVQQHDINPAYSPYSGTTYAVSLGQTVYCGTLTDNGDGTWTLQITHQLVDAADVTWTPQSANLTTWLYSSTHFSGPSNAHIAERYVKWTGAINETPRNNFRVSGTIGVYVNTGDNTSAENKPQGKFVLQLNQTSVPAPVTLTAESVRTLLGQNNIFADCGDVASLTYRADPTLYIDKKLAALGG